MVPILGSNSWPSTWLNDGENWNSTSESIGEVVEIDVEGEQMAWAQYLKVRVVVDITKPLK